MRIGTCVFVCVALCALSLSSVPASAGPDDYLVEWSIFLPRQTYFIGEEIAFSIEAHSSINLAIPIPGEYANIQILDENDTDVYDWQAMTDTNGTANLYWNTTVYVEPGEYRILLTDSYKNTIEGNFTLLWDQETYNNGRLDDLQRQIDERDRYLDYLFLSNNFLSRKYLEFKRMLWVGFGTAFGSFLLIFSIWVADRAQKSNQPQFREKAWAKGFRSLGISSTPPSRLTDKQPEVAGYVCPPEKLPPRYGMTEFCDICDPDHKKPMTKARLEEHKIAHERYFVKLQPYLRERALRKAYKELYQKSVKERTYVQDEHPELIERERLLVLSKTLTSDVKSGKLTGEQVAVESAYVRAQWDEFFAKYPKQKPTEKPDVPKPNIIEPVKPVLKQTTSAKVQVIRKVRTEKRFTDIPKPPIQQVKRTSIDELESKLKQEMT